VGPRVGLEYSKGTGCKCRSGDRLYSLIFFWSPLQIPGYTSNYDRFLPHRCQYYSLITVRSFERKLTNYAFKVVVYDDYKMQRAASTQASAITIEVCLNGAKKKYVERKKCVHLANNTVIKTVFKFVGASHSPWPQTFLPMSYRLPSVNLSCTAIIYVFLFLHSSLPQTFLSLTQNSKRHWP